MIETRMRPVFQRLFVENIARLLIRITPDKITLLSLLCGVLAAFFISFDFRIFAIVLLLLSGYLDILDGSIARIQNSSSAFGTMLDIISDRFVEASIILSFYIRQNGLGLITLLMMMSIVVCISSFLVVGIFSRNEGPKSFFHSPGLMERAEAFIFFGIMILWPQVNFVAGSLFTVLVFWTAFYRMYEFYKYDKASA